MTSSIRELIQSCAHQTVRFESGELLVRQGSFSDSLFLVLSGELRVWLSRDDRTDLVGVARTGEVVGEAAVLAPGPAPTMISASPNSTAYRIDHAELARLWREAPLVAQEIHRFALVGLLGRLREANCEQGSYAGLPA